MEIAFLQVISRSGRIKKNIQSILSAENRIPTSDLCLCPANALVGADLGAWTYYKEMQSGILEAVEVLAKESKHPLILPLFIESKGELKPTFFFINNGTVKELPVMKLCPDTNISNTPSLWGAELFWGELTFALVFVTQDIPNANPLEALYLLRNPSCAFMLPKSDGIIVFTLLPWWNGLERVLEEEMREIAIFMRTHAFLVNPVSLHDGLCYHGRSTLFDSLGNELVHCKAFEEDSMLLSVTPKTNIRCFEQRDKPEELLWRAIVFALREFTTGAKYDVVIGLSGGIDSALVFVAACSSLGVEHVHPVFMPSPYTSESSAQDCIELCKRFSCELDVISIEPLMDAYAKALKPIFDKNSAQNSETTFENIQARIRGSLLCAYANRSNALILNTSNKSEAAVGYSTLYGDTVGAFSVLGDILKTQIYELAHWYNDTHEPKIPDSILEKEPSAELAFDQKDTDTLPPYESLDPLILSLLHGKIPKGCDAKIVDRIFANEFKRRQFPPTLVVSKNAFNYSCKVPITGCFEPR